MFQFGCTRCGKQCKNAGGLATHMKTHTKKKVDSPSLLLFFKRAPAKKIAVELKPIKKKPQQIKLRAISRPKPLRHSKENSPFFGFSNLFDQTWKLTKTQHVKFASQKEPFQEHMSVGAKFLDDLLHLESVVFWTSKKLPWGATVPPYLSFWTARLFLRLNSFDFKDIFTQKLTQIKLISTKKQHFSSVRQMGGRSFTSSNKHIQNKGGNI